MATGTLWLRSGLANRQSYKSYQSKINHHKKNKHGKVATGKKNITTPVYVNHLSHFVRLYHCLHLFLPAIIIPTAAIF